MIIGVIQARMKSTRLPGKMLYPIGGEPLIGHVMDFATGLQLDDVYLATSEDPENDILCEWAGEYGVNVIREPGEDDVYFRFLSATKTGADHIMRICGDSPCLDTSLANRLIKLSKTSRADYIAYAFGEYPAILTTYGIFTEIIRSDALIMGSTFTSPEYREHVTNMFYKNRQMFSVEYIQAPTELSGYHFKLSVDDMADYQAVRDFYEIGGCNNYHNAIDNIEIVRNDNILQEYEWHV